MILTDEQIKERIKNPVSKDLLELARQQSKRLHKYVTGEGLKESIESLPYFEKDELTPIRRKLSRSTVDLMERLLEPLGKVFTAKGGSELYNLPSSQEAKFVEYLSSIRKGLSVKEWLQFVALRAKLLDPMSVTHNEVNGNGEVYPTYKSTDVIHDYLLNGRQPEYIIYELQQAEVKGYVSAGLLTLPAETAKVYRVVDDTTDKLVILYQDELTTGLTYLNYFGKVPARINGDRMLYNSDYIESDLQPVMELVEDFFNDNSSKSLFKKYQMHAKEWGIHVECKKCEGTGLHNGETCDLCKGSGQANTKVAQTLAIALDDDGAAKVPTPPGGFIVPPIESWQMVNEELDRIKSEVTDTFWTEGQSIKTQGLSSNDTGAGKTATEVVMSERHKEPKLKQFSKWAQDMHKFITDACLLVMYRNSKGSSVVYGDRYLLQSPEELTTQYEDLRTKKAPISILDSALIDLIEAKFSGNTFLQRKHIMLMRVEPFVHFNKNEVITWMNVSDELKGQKLLFDQWLSTKTDMEIVGSTEGKLRQDLAAFAQKGLVPTPAPIPTKVAA